MKGMNELEVAEAIRDEELVHRNILKRFVWSICELVALVPVTDQN